MTFQVINLVVAVRPVSQPTNPQLRKYSAYQDFFVGLIRVGKIWRLPKILEDRRAFSPATVL